MWAECPKETIMQRRDLLSHFSLGCFGSLASLPALATQPPALWLANPYQGNEELSDYWVSEKFDGIRGYWDGRQLLSRSGKTLNPPTWFVQAWPTQPFEGELWAGLGQFEQAASVIQQKQAPDSSWRAMRFMVFDANTSPQAFTDRIVRYQSLVKQIGKPWVQAVPQSQVPSHAALKAMLSKTVQAGGEGLVLHRGSSLYQSGRNSDVLKFKATRMRKPR
jgi:DNA ligase-1